MSSCRDFSGDKSKGKAKWEVKELLYKDEWYLTDWRIIIDDMSEKKDSMWFIETKMEKVWKMDKWDFKKSWVDFGCPYEDK